MSERIKNRVVCMVLSALMLVACNGTTPPSKPNKGFEPYEPSVEINASNLFKVCLFSTMTDEPLFASRAQSVVSSFISGYAGQKPIVYMIERSDCELGKSLPHLGIARDNRSYSFFAPQSPSDSQIRGTGIITRYSVTEYDGVADDSLRISGCRIDAPLSAPTALTIFTMRLDDSLQMKKLVDCRSLRLRTDGIVVGSIDRNLKESVVEWLKFNFTDYRIAFGDYDASSPYDLFVLTPVDYVCREVEQGERVSIPYFTVSIEKLK